ncbi:unnamed protein product [Chondrus crispus]|uniref:Major coat protein L-A virus domain-containing protein n=1 Tax=Chondrus crispus TaxID=2769 RepID=R7QPM0_CHOCR|nr:unnamed protein product [Chondrus crispus]CDF39728.1 unnamed protein product [Chondrus crispus]|eukprot:XP_005710022.1 unnamed protein product [Chondrus crispus]
MNSSFIAESGFVDPELIAPHIRPNAGMQRATRIRIEANAAGHLRDDSQVALLVGLLSQLYVQEFREAGLTESVHAYADGHVGIKVEDIMDIPDLAEQWQPDMLMDIEGWDPEAVEMSSECNVVRCDGLTKKEISLLLTVMGGRAKTTKLAFDLAIPRLCDKVYVNATMNLVSGDPIATDDVTAQLCRATLDRYVDTNRLHAQFEVAFAIFHQCALAPVPDRAEGMAWLKRKRELVLPAFSAFRGHYRTILAGDAYGLSASALLTWRWWRNAGISTAVHGGMYNAASLWGRYFVEAEDFFQDADLEQVRQHRMSDAPAVAYYRYASMITGHKAYCPVPAGFGMRYLDWKVNDALTLPVSLTGDNLLGYDIETSEDGSLLHVRHIPPPASHIHVLARLPRDGAFKSLSDKFSLTITARQEGWTVPSVMEAWGLGMALGWLGYDAEMSYRGETRIGNWVSNQSQIAAKPFSISGPDVEAVKVLSIEHMRQHSLLPGLNEKVSRWNVEVAVEGFSIRGLSMGTVALIGAFKATKSNRVDVISSEVGDIVYLPVTYETVHRGITTR